MTITLPTPMEILLDPVSLTVIAMYAGLIIWEAVAPAKNQHESRPQVGAGR